MLPVPTRTMRPFRPVGEGKIKIAIVGEAPGEQEEKYGEPFIGASGGELTRMLRDGGIIRHDCYITNVFLERPSNNEIAQFCTNKPDAKTSYPIVRPELCEAYPNFPWPDSYDFAAVGQGLSIRPDRLGALARLRDELIAVQPNLVLALGNTACWALLSTSGISKLRGTVASSTLIPGLKVIPTYHPSAVLRTWALRAVTVADFMKASREQDYPEIIRPKRTVWIEPTIEDILTFKRDYLDKAKRISWDVETERGQITCIGFSPDETKAIVIPFWDKRKEDWNYWQDAQEELKVWNIVRDIIQLPCEKLAQNGMYDIQYLWRAHGIVPKGTDFHDTMLMHHALFPEMEKGLGFLGSIYTNEASWKIMRPRGQKEEKKDA